MQVLADGGEGGQQEQPSEQNQCLVEEDLDFETCNVDDLPIDSLKAICTRLGLDMEENILSYLLEEEDEGEASADQEKAAANPDKEYTRENYVAGAYECLLIEQEMYEMEDEGMNPEDFLAEDPEFLADIVKQMIEADPNIIKEVEEELKQEEPEFWNELSKKLKEGETLKDRPDLMAELLLHAVSEEPSLFEEMFSDEGDDEEGDEEHEAFGEEL